MYIYIYIIPEKKVANQRRKNLKNDAKIKGKCPVIFFYYESYKFLFLGDIFLSFMHRFSRFCAVGCRFLRGDTESERDFENRDVTLNLNRLDKIVFAKFYFVFRRKFRILLLHR